MKPTPNFFILGAPKCGTTALSEYLHLHPNVFFSDPKEPEYFAADFPVRLISRERDYLGLFRSADPSRHLAIGEGSTLYLFSEEAVPNILRFQPQARMIAMVRNPAQLVESFHSHLLSEGIETLASFEEAWAAEAERRQGRRLPPGARNPQWLYYSEWGKLGSQLQRLMNLAPKGQWMAILYDDFARDTRRVYQETLKFLNLPDDGRKEFPVINKRRHPKNVRLQKWIGALLRWWMPMRVHFTGGRGLGLGNFLNKITTRPARANQIPVETHRMLLDYYHDEIRLMETLLDRDLGHWLDN